MRIRPHDLNGDGFESGDYAVQIQDGVVGFTPLPDGGGSGGDLALHIDPDAIAAHNARNIQLDIDGGGSENLGFAVNHLNDFVNSRAALLNDHIFGSESVHPASAIDYAGGSSLPASTVEAAIDSLDTRTSYDLRGTGFPGTGANAAATDAAPVGSTYTDTDVTAGALHWTKYAAGTGTSAWRVTCGDTGPRALRDSDLGANWTRYSTDATRTLTVRRVGETVTINGILNAGTGIALTVFTLPAGMRPGRPHGAPIYLTVSRTLVASRYLEALPDGSLTLNASIGANAVTVQAFSFPVAAAAQWPASLPYAPA